MDLKPCPFCGGEAKLKPVQRGRFTKGYWSIIHWCSQADSIVFTGDEKEALVEKWNRRAGANQWISVKDRLPEQMEAVLVYFQNGKIRISEITGVTSSTAFSFESIYGAAIYWMPLPEPPGEV